MSSKVTPEEIQEMLRKLGTKEAVPHTGKKGNHPKHIQPEILKLIRQCRAPIEYPEWWKKHAKSCKQCQSLFKEYGISLY